MRTFVCVVLLCVSSLVQAQDCTQLQATLTAAQHEVSMQSTRVVAACYVSLMSEWQVWQAEDILRDLFLQEWHLDQAIMDSTDPYNTDILYQQLQTLQVQIAEATTAYGVAMEIAAEALVSVVSEQATLEDFTADLTAAQAAYDAAGCGGQYPY